MASWQLRLTLDGEWQYLSARQILGRKRNSSGSVVRDDNKNQSTSKFCGNGHKSLECGLCVRVLSRS
jgi:hypothetical protein